MPRRKGHYKRCPECSLRVAKGWHTPSRCRRYARIVALFKKESVTFAEIGKRVRMTKERIRQIALACGVGSGHERQRAYTMKKRLEAATTPELKKVICEAQRRGLTVERLRGRHRVHIRFYARRLLIGGKRCQIMMAFRVRQLPHHREPYYVRLRAPKTKWAEFIVHVLREGKRKRRTSFFIVPRKEAIHTTFAYPSSKPSRMARYANAWYLLSRPSRVADRSR